MASVRSSRHRKRKRAEDRHDEPQRVADKAWGNRSASQQEKLVLETKVHQLQVELRVSDASSRCTCSS